MKKDPFSSSLTKQSRSNYIHHYHHVIVKLGVSLLLIGLAFRLLVSDYYYSFNNLHNDKNITTTTTNVDVKDDGLSTENSKTEASSFVDDFTLNVNRTDQEVVGKKCDLFIGDWVRDTSGPFYTNWTCTQIQGHQNCMKNGRPDSDFLYWRWNPRGCKLPRFDPVKFLEFMRNKWLAFFGDSISRNHVQSLYCILTQVEQAVEVHHDEEYRSYIWRFPSYNFTLSVIWTPLLLKSAIFEDMNGVSSSEIQLYLDKLDEKWTKHYSNFDYAVTSGGKWFLKTAIYHEDNKVTGCHYCAGKNLTELGFDYAYRKALQLVFKFITSSNHKAVVLFRTTTPDHFENGEWNTGGACNRKVPFKESEIDMSDVDRIMHKIEIEEFEKATASLAAEGGAVLKLLDTTRLSLLRPDGHPGPYREFQPFAKDKNAKVQNDCLHWCLPGPIDSWNELIMEIMVNGTKYR